MYSNIQGCDGERVYYDGSSLIALNGDLIAQGTQFSMNEIEVITATVDMEDIRTYRDSSFSNMLPQNTSQSYQRISVQFNLTYDDSLIIPVTPAAKPFYNTPEEEIARGPACWLWDFLRRSGASGFFLPLSGGR